MLEAMYENHPVRIDIAGTVESISHITADLLYKCYNTFYNPSNMFVCIAGNVNSDEVLERIEKGIKPTAPVVVNRADFSEGAEVKNRYVEKRMEVAKPIFCFGFKEQCEGERTLKERIESGILLDVLAGGASPLYESLTKKGLINDEFDSEYFHGNGYSVVLFQGESDNPQAVCDAISAEIERLRRDGIPQELFESARKGTYGTAIKGYNNVEMIAMNLVDCAMAGFGPFDDLEILRNLKKEDVEARLSLIKPESSVLSVILPKR
jgi:predicted Zn-dependent peptidase